MTEYTNVEKPFLDKLRQAHWQVIDQELNVMALIIDRCDEKRRYKTEDCNR